MFEVLRDLKNKKGKPYQGYGQMNVLKFNGYILYNMLPIGQSYSAHYLILAPTRSRNVTFIEVNLANL